MVEKTIWENDKVIIRLVEDSKLTLNIYYHDGKNNFNTSFDITEWINEVKRSINF